MTVSSILRFIVKPTFGLFFILAAVNHQTASFASLSLCKVGYNNCVFHPEKRIPLTEHDDMRISPSLLPLHLLLLAWSLHAISLFAADTEPESTPIKIGVFEQKPLLFQDNESFLMGFYADLLKGLEKETGWTLEYSIVPPGQAQDKLQQGDLDLFIGLPYASNYMEDISFSSESILTVWGEVYTAYAHQDLQNIFDVQGKLLAAKQNSAIAEAFAHQCDMFRLSCEFKFYKDSPSVFAAVANGEADAAVMDSLYGALYAGDYDLRRTQIIFEPTHLHIVAAKHQSARLLRSVDKILSHWKIQSASVFYQAQKRWLSGLPLRVPQQDSPYKWQRTALLAMGAALILSLLALYLLYKRMQKQQLKLLDERNIEHVKERKYFTLLEHLPYGLEELELDGTLVFCNQMAQKICDASADEMLGKPVFDLLESKEDRLELRTYVDNLITQKPNNPEPYYATLRYRDGQACNVRMEWYYKHDIQGEIMGFHVILNDITEVRQTQTRIRNYHVDLKRLADERKADLIEAYNELLVTAAVFENTGEAIMVIDLETCLQSVNPAFQTITGYDKDQCIGQPLAILASKKHDEQIYINLWKQLVENGHWQGEVWNQRPGVQNHEDNGIYPAWLSINAVQNAEADVVQYVVLLSDITKRKQYEKQIWRQANYDALTKLPNRNLFHRRLEQALEESPHAEQPQIGLMFIDLDHFKEVNDTLGHDAGDELLKAATKRLSACVGKQDTVARMGGDEFTVVLPQLKSTEMATEIAANILKQLNMPFPLPQGTVQISGSIGIVIYPHDGDDITTLLKNADIAMYRIKERGRNGYFLYSDLEDSAALHSAAHAVVQVKSS